MYRELKKKGHSMNVPPWMQIVFITGGILKDVHTTNIMNEIHREQHNPEAIRAAQEIMRQQYEAQQARARDQTPYHVSSSVGNVHGMERPTTFKSDSDIEDTLAREFAGFDKLPSIASISSKRKDMIDAQSSESKGPSPQLPTIPARQVQTTTTTTVNVDTPPRIDRDVRLIHEPSLIVNKDKGDLETKVSMIHPKSEKHTDDDSRPDSRDAGEEDEGGEEEGEGLEEEDSFEEGEEVEGEFSEDGEQEEEGGGGGGGGDDAKDAKKLEYPCSIRIPTIQQRKS
jgi:hypothetical protein